MLRTLECQATQRDTGQRAGQHPQSLGVNLQPRRRADKGPGFQVMHHVGALPGGAAGDVGGHQVGRHVARRDRAIG